MTEPKKSKVDERIDQLEDVVQETLEGARQQIAHAETAMEHAKDAVGDGYGRLRERGAEAYSKAKEYLADARSSLESVREKISQLYGKSREAVEEAYEKAKAKLEKLSEDLKRAWEVVKAKIAEIDFKAIKDDVVGYIQRNPGKSLLIALAVGFAVGYLVRPREA
jgi:ElaB/YqjD/DUF883 family membrane-anchored ribosome-binding protein